MKLIKQAQQAQKLSVAVYLQDGAEILDLAAPIEVFRYAGMQVFTLGLDGNSIRSQGVVTIQPDYTIDNCPRADIVVF
ncbi:MAG: DJ-1/PfpI family protein, partial [Bacteroidota bacterium]